ncbi:MAG: hypothetical protein F6K09_01890 [Merismopedia sp. SIO2A8]|nr:hypothetical protein [Merismopedia sp. SIO2A8]
MSHCCHTPNPLIRDGVSQSQRHPAALSPDYVRVDERELADFLVFAYQLAQQVKYYTIENEQVGNWQSLFANSTPVWIAVISKTKAHVLSRTYQQQLEGFIKTQSPPQLASILGTWVQILTHLQRWYGALNPQTPLKAMIQGLIATHLAVPLTQMRQIDLAYEAETGERLTSDSLYATFEQAPFQLELGDAIANPTPFHGTRFEARTLLDQIFQGFFQVYHQIILMAPQYLMPSLEAQANHQPHITLYIAFLELMKSVQGDLNRMTQRHLDFFYQEVLQLPRRLAQPDQVHLLFELAKAQQQYGLQADIRFKAGKDATGVALFYKLDQDVVLDNAQVGSLKSLLLASRPASSSNPSRVIIGLYASPIANSADGKGGPFSKEQSVQAWLPFGDRTRNLATVGLAIASPLLLLKEGDRTITFAFEFDPGSISPQLPVNNRVPVTRLVQLFDVSFSGEKDWVQASIADDSEDTNWNGSILKLTVKLAPDADAVVAYHDKLPGAILQTTLPVVRIHLRERSPTNALASDPVSNTRPPAAYHYFQGVTMTQVAITTRVKGLRNLVLQNDLSVLDATKPFQPFGPQPKAGSTFYIGSQEVFQKPLTDLTITLNFETDAPGDWADYYAGYESANTIEPGKLKIQALRGKQWHPIAAPGVQLNLFDTPLVSAQLSSPQAFSILQQVTLDKAEATEPITVWNHESKNGFLRCQLDENGGFLHNEYPKALSRQVLAQAMAASESPKAVVGASYRVSAGTPPTIAGSPTFSATTIPDTAEVVLPNEPFTPVIQSLVLDYTAREVLTLAVRSSSEQTVTTGENPAIAPSYQFFHLYPFDRAVKLELSSVKSFVPTFDQEGSLLIGVKNLQSQSILNMLIQVAEETADTDLKTAEVHWHYLQDNTWIEFEDQHIVSDRTNGLIQSGIIQLAIPADISRTHTTRLDPNFHWLRVSVPERSGAIPQIIGIHAQAATATFVDENGDKKNDPNHLATPLPAQTIAKLVTPQPAIKAIQQPYPSTNGRPSEKSDHYYTRISEHLRHKGRAITMFDYERLVLERFPEIYKVRCINHGQMALTSALNSGQDLTLRELVPGSVTLAVIPDLTQQSVANALTPKVNINLLDAIKQDLQTLCSSWVDLHVVNPLYEAIRVEFQVRFHAPYEANFAYYRQQLNQAIVGFLSPWTVAASPDIHFGGKVYRSSILNFVEEQTYVDHVINFKLHQGDRQDLREVQATTARSILVSVPFQAGIHPGHTITPIPRP